MTDREKILKLIEANSALRSEMLGVSGQAQGMAQWADDNNSKDGFKRLEARIDNALEADDKAIDKIIFGS